MRNYIVSGLVIAVLLPPHAPDISTAEVNAQRALPAHLSHTEIDEARTKVVYRKATAEISASYSAIQLVSYR